MVMHKPEPVVKVRDLQKIYGEGCPECKWSQAFNCEENRCSACGSIIACTDVSFDVYPGEILGIVGESGSGKSTVLSLMNMNSDPTRGEVFYKGYKNGRKNIFEADSQYRRELKNNDFGIVYQNPYIGLNFTVSAEGNIAERLLLGGERDFSPMHSNVLDYFDKVEMPRSRNKDLPSCFSGGMQQRVQIAKALVSKPSLILLDEPTGGLDVSVQAKILDLIRTISREVGVAMVIVSHDMEVIRLLCKRIIVMKHGRIIEKGLTDRVIDDPEMPYTQMLVHSTL